MFQVHLDKDLNKNIFPVSHKRTFEVLLLLYLLELNQFCTVGEQDEI